MNESILYIIERAMMLIALTGISGYAIYQWKVASLKPKLLAELEAKAKAKVHENMAAEREKHEALIDGMNQRLHKAQAWVDARKREAFEVTEPLYDDIAKAQSEYFKMLAVCRNVQSLVKLVDGLSKHKHFTDSITKSQKSRMQSTANEAKAEIKAITREVSDLKLCAEKIEKYLKATEWHGTEPPKVQDEESDDEALD